MICGCKRLYLLNPWSIKLFYIYKTYAKLMNLKISCNYKMFD